MVDSIFEDFERCPFPKHRDRLWTEVVEEDRHYVIWLVGPEGPTMSEELYDHLIELLEEGADEY